jgi:hypothetical protein
MSSTLRVVLGSDDIVDCDEALLFEATARWLEHYPANVGNQQDVCLSLLRLVRFPIMDSCLLSDVIKGHPLMVGAERTNLLLEAFEHHALRYSAPKFFSFTHSSHSKACHFSTPLLNYCRSQQGCWPNWSRVIPQQTPQAVLLIHPFDAFERTSGCRQRFGESWRLAYIGILGLLHQGMGD